MAAMGLLEEVYRLPMVPPQAGVEGEDRARCSRSSGCSRRRLRVGDREALETEINRTGRGRRSRRSRRGARRRSRGCARRCPPGEVRAAEPDASSPIGWRVNTWVKQGILLGFRFGDIVDVSMDHGTLAVLRQGHAAAEEVRASRAGIRIVPGGSAIRDGAYLAPGVICMPPMYVNIGAWVGEHR